MKTCACRIAGPLGIGAVLGETPVRKLDGPEGYYGLSLCPLHAAAEDLLDVAQMLLDAGEDCTDTTCLHVICCATRAARVVVAKARRQSAPASGESDEPAS